MHTSQDQNPPSEKQVATMPFPSQRIDRLDGVHPAAQNAAL
jgi:hypothetical protein